MKYLTPYHVKCTVTIHFVSYDALISFQKIRYDDIISFILLIMHLLKLKVTCIMRYCGVLKIHGGSILMVFPPQIHILNEKKIWKCFLTETKN